METSGWSSAQLRTQRQPRRASLCLSMHEHVETAARPLQTFRHIAESVSPDLRVRSQVRLLQTSSSALKRRLSSVHVRKSSSQV